MYQLDGKKIEYVKCMESVFDALVAGVDVFYAYHHGVDVYWIREIAPSWADEVELTISGIELKYKEKMLEPFDMILKQR
tara:strand:+ start:1053 stop:1289 length:237 start_codon:yes stop_codon:yes gene_type:complete